MLAPQSFLLLVAGVAALHSPCSRCPRNADSNSRIQVSDLEKQSLAKEDLLRQLGLNDRPSFGNRDKSTALFKSYLGELNVVDDDEAEIETKEVFVFGQRDKFCESDPSSLCVKFNLSINASIQSASLRVNLRRDRLPASVLVQVANAQRSLVSGGESKAGNNWLSIDATRLLHHWADRDLSTVHEAQISCSNCDPGLDWLAHDMPIFLEVNVASRVAPANRRRRRSSDCSLGENKGCCLQSFYINFTMIQWDDWILEPPGYYVNYCTGVCAVGHATNIASKMAEAQARAEGQTSQSCCSPKAYGSLTIIYTTELLVYYKKNLKQMIVTDCGC